MTFLHIKPLFGNQISSSIRQISYFSRPNYAIDYCDVVRRYPIPDAYKEIDRLNRGELFPVISAMSSYSHSGWDENVLDNGEWTTKVIKLALRRDISVDRSFAFHIEKQRLAFYVEKHGLFDREFDDIRNANEYTGLEKQGELRFVHPIKVLIEAVIIASQQRVCDNCQNFKRLVCDKLSLDVTLRYLVA